MSLRKILRPAFLFVAALFTGTLVTGALLTGARGATTPSLANSVDVTGKIRVESARAGDPGAAKKGHEDNSGVVVWLSPLEGNGQVAGTAPPDAPHARMIQKGKTFIPHVLPVQAGTLVDFPNLDPIFHNAFSSFSGQIFDIGLYPPGGTKSIRFHREGLVQVFCNIHSTMNAVIVVVGSPYFAMTTAGGDYRLQNVAPGNYLLRVYDEKAEQSALRRLEQRVAIGRQAEEKGAAQNLGLIRIQETESALKPHKNKYGRDYPAEGGYFK